MELLSYLRTQVRANHLANRRLYAAMAPLTQEELHAARTSFFPGLAKTLNHILAVDHYYLAALHEQPDMEAQWRTFRPRDTLAALQEAQTLADLRFITLLDGLRPEQLDDVLSLDRGDRVLREPRGHVVAHLLNHQVHHRGQAHAMLAGTAVKPPQLDEFLMPSEAHLRHDDMAALGWTEASLFRGAHDPGR
jgi:uncharacterized damage-inducible protein DinB